MSEAFVLRYRFFGEGIDSFSFVRRLEAGMVFERCCLIFGQPIPLQPGARIIKMPLQSLKRARRGLLGWKRMRSPSG